MGFRDMKKFNQALQARQAWRLIQFPESLCARLLKAKYYPNGELVDTIFPSNASPTWRSIECGLELLKQGIVWRVGSGSKIQIWRDPWLPRATSRKILMKKGRARIRWVAQLMVPGRREWDIPLLRTVLFPHEVQEVLKVRLSDRAYHLAMSLDDANRDQPGCSARADGSRPVFKCIWSANVPPKVRVFAWRLAREGLATQTNRKCRGLEREALCQICGSEDESGYHAVVRCSRATALRYELRNIWHLPEERRFSYTGPDWLLHLLASLDKDTRDKTMLILWRAWHHRHNIMHGNGSATVRESVEFLKSYAAIMEGSSRPPATGTSSKGKEKV
jgi:hypothetical protein